jgi:hypothetical protein
MEKISSEANLKVKAYKIAYSINLVPFMGSYIKTIEDAMGHREYQFMNRDVQLMDLCADSIEIDIFKAENLLEIINYKWENYGYKHHIIGFSAHLFYVVIFCLYVQLAYIN